MQVEQGGLSPTYVTAAELERRLSHGEAFSILDVRSPDRYRASGRRIPGSIRIPPDELPARRSEIPRGRTVLLVADEESAPTQALALMQDGYTDVYLIEGGFPAWERLGAPTKDAR